ncbi:hypothetical protein E2C01_042325 [Portunus trituberculatus]|uniref:Uncharacterized protein n=1 Tax=Portunus trituberculatus TaxID=210409 RepID=A0A5B7FUH1_PORTR|nr:hypothetical protein [Portunus trituberculatus]
MVNYRIISSRVFGGLRAKDESGQGNVFGDPWPSSGRLRKEERGGAAGDEKISYGITTYQTQGFLFFSAYASLTLHITVTYAILCLASCLGSIAAPTGILPHWPWLTALSSASESRQRPSPLFRLTGPAGITVKDTSVLIWRDPLPPAGRAGREGEGG